MVPCYVRTVVPNDVLEGPGPLPNDVFKRPGPHHAYEVDPTRLAQLRAAFDALSLLGDDGPLAALLDRPAAEIHDAGVLSEAYTYCLVDEGFGLQHYGPMFERMALFTTFGEPLIPVPNPLVEPVSHVWIELSPWLPQQVAPASEIYVDLDLVTPPAAAWDVLLTEITGDRDNHDLFQVPDETDDAFDRRIDRWIESQRAEYRVLIERWRVECRSEVETFVSKVREIGDRDGLVATWHSEQGWL